MNLFQQWFQRENQRKLEETGLKSVETKDLVEELFSRHSYGFIILGEIDPNNSDYIRLQKWKGGFHALIGFLTKGIQEMTLEIDKKINNTKDFQ